MSGRDAEREIERQLEVLAEGAEAFHGVDDLRPRLAQAVAAGPAAPLAKAA